ncbi:MAG: stage II sporulation protein D [Clostridiales bacterium]|nr:stage II sporulation protein D [Clostridiales bacterium]
MKRILILFAVIGLMVLAIPLLTLFQSGAESADPQDAAPPETTVEPDEPVTLYVTGEEKVINLSVTDYLTGVIFAEMGGSYELEAIKAQAVASYTYYLYTKAAQLKSPDTTLMGAYISDNPSKHQSYIGSEEAKEKFGDNYELYYSKISQAVEEVLGVYMTYKDDPILAVFHASNNGYTQSSKNVWGKDYKYLQSVESSGDALSPDLTSTAKFTQKAFQDACQSLEDADLSGDASDWVGKVKTEKTGFVESIVIGGEQIEGTEARTLFSLKSSCFTVEYDEKAGEFIFTVQGYGHGVGRSQYGADYMARQGASYDEILRHYYTGIQFAAG